jgi:hypothetical protein
MRDLVYIALTVGFFGLASLFVVACDRIVGPDPTSGAMEGGARDTDTDTAEPASVEPAALEAVTR